MEKISYMKILDRVAIIIANLAIIIALGVGPALLLASSEDYYHRQFEKNEILRALQWAVTFSLPSGRWLITCSSPSDPIRLPDHSSTIH